MAAPREGSSLYYSLLWTTPERRLRLLNRLTMIDAIATTLHDVQEPAVAERKIHWWHEELDRLAKSEARHPALQACQQGLADTSVITQPAVDILSVAASNRFTPADTNEEASQRMQLDYTARLILVAHALNDDDALFDRDRRRLTPLALAVGRYDRLARLPFLLSSGYTVFSAERYRRHGLTPTQFSEGIGPAIDAAESEAGKSQQRQALLQEAIAEAHATFLTARRDIVCQNLLSGSTMQPLTTLTRLRERKIKLWKKRAPDLLRGSMTLTPVHKLVLAWWYRS
ncbi:MAG: hypothetical protein V3U76_16475 [Granulosicoccus sp.]